MPKKSKTSVFDKKLSQEEAWIRKGIKARRTRNEGRVRSLEKMRAAYRARRGKIGDVRLQAQEAERTGKLVIEAKAVSFSYDQTPIVRDFSTVIMRGDKVGIIGPNGVGKTTLLKILLKEIEPGEREVSVTAPIFRSPILTSSGPSWMSKRPFRKISAKATTLSFLTVKNAM